MAIDFPDSPNVNDVFTSGDKTWTYDGVKWSITAAVNAAKDLDDLDDVTITLVEDGQVLKYNSISGIWENGLGATTLDDLTDVEIANVATNEILSYNGNTWVNASAPETGTTVQKGNNTMTYLIMEVSP